MSGGVEISKLRICRRNHRGKYQSFLSVTFPNVKVISGFPPMNYFSLLFNVTLRGVRILG